MKIKNKEWNQDLVGYCCETNDGRYFQVQFEKQHNPLHGGYGEYFPVLDVINDYPLDFTEEEKEELRELILMDDEFQGTAEVITLADIDPE